MKRTSLILSILIILAIVTSPTWAQVGPVIGRSFLAVFDCLTAHALNLSLLAGPDFT